jgi:hypothetical protein
MTRNFKVSEGTGDKETSLFEIITLSVSGGSLTYPAMSISDNISFHLSYGARLVRDMWLGILRPGTDCKPDHFLKLTVLRSMCSGYILKSR